MKTDLNTLPTMLTPDELAQFLRISKTGVYRLVEKRVIPFYRVSGSLRFSKSDVVSFLSGNRIESVI
jgi:excisionase family DNA binding protein